MSYADARPRELHDPVEALAQDYPEANAQLEGSFEWAETLRRLSSTGVFDKKARGLPQTANAIFAEVAGCDIREARVNLAGFKEALARFAPTVFPDKTKTHGLKEIA